MLDILSIARAPKSGASERNESTGKRRATWYVALWAHVWLQYVWALRSHLSIACLVGRFACESCVGYSHGQVSGCSCFTAAFFGWLHVSQKSYADVVTGWRGKSMSFHLLSLNDPAPRWMWLSDFGHFAYSQSIFAWYSAASPADHYRWAFCDLRALACAWSCLSLAEEERFRHEPSHYVSWRYRAPLRAFPWLHASSLH